MGVMKLLRLYWAQEEHLAGAVGQVQADKARSPQPDGAIKMEQPLWYLTQSPDTCL